MSSRGDFRSESGRRRHASSSTRPVSSTEYPDLYQLLGLAKPGDGQVSYSFQCQTGFEQRSYN